MSLQRLDAISDRVEAELTKMVNDRIITPVTEPMHWVSALLDFQTIASADTLVLIESAAGYNE